VGEREVNMTRVNMFVDMDTELVKESSKKAEEEITQESSSKRAGEELDKRIHFVRFEDMHVYKLVEKRYPLTPPTITDMLNKKLQADYWNEMCYQLLKLMTKQLKKQ
ncbi:hypothetical protein Tco_1150249, partial [Tanacetum coccineum]